MSRYRRPANNAKFGRNAVRTHRKNLVTSRPMRGGIRM